MSGVTMFTAKFEGHESLAAWLIIAQAHGGRILPKKTKEVPMGGVSSAMTTRITVEIPHENVASFKLCVGSTELLQSKEPFDLLEQ